MLQLAVVIYSTIPRSTTTTIAARSDKRTTCQSFIRTRVIQARCSYTLFTRWSKLRAHVVHVHFEYVCFIFASCLLHRVNGVLTMWETAICSTSRNTVFLRGRPNEPHYGSSPGVRPFLRSSVPYGPTWTSSRCPWVPTRPLQLDHCG